MQGATIADIEVAKDAYVGQIDAQKGVLDGEIDQHFDEIEARVNAMMEGYLQQAYNGVEEHITGELNTHGAAQQGELKSNLDEASAEAQEELRNRIKQAKQELAALLAAREQAAVDNVKAHFDAQIEEKKVLLQQLIARLVTQPAAGGGPGVSVP
ncbi:hypothetical protein [Paenibacillus xerothermodurans]|uniref:Uncharacterized protein n=1 Tax=Paenibacillus xerothermodurans TaxID=1977292 RepID=A0A2W1N9X6_PAEXE|nr:hypothetical protein [Paenibacillus xerothermodurans]PZE20460.1 hypothetical protein CBW46_013590 [Paenibacillus xerothermodurans]